MSENSGSSYYYSDEEYSYDTQSEYDYSYYSDDDELDKQIKFYKDAIMDIKLANEKNNAFQQAQQIIQRQQQVNAQNISNKSPDQLQNSVPQHTQDIVEITKAAIKTAIESQAQVLATQLPQSRFIQHQVEQPLIGQVQEPEQQQQEIQNMNNQQVNEEQNLEDSIKQQYESKIQQLENTSKLFDQQQEQVKQMNYQHQKQIQKLQEDNEKHKRDAENYAAKVDDREDIIKNLTKLLKKKDPNFNITNVLQNKQLIEQMVKMQQEDTQNNVSPDQPKQLQTQNNTYYQQQHQQQQPQQQQYNDDSQRYRQITRSSIDMNNDDGVPFSPKRVQKGRLNPMSPTNSMRASQIEDINVKQAEQIKQQQHRGSINFDYPEDKREDDVGIVKSKAFGRSRNLQQQIPIQPPVQNYKEQQYNTQQLQYQTYNSQSNQMVLNSANYRQQQNQIIDEEEFTRLKEENDNYLLKNTTKQRQSNFQLNWDTDDTYPTRKRRVDIEQRNNPQQASIPQTQNTSNQQILHNQPTIQQNNHDSQQENQDLSQQGSAMSFDEFLRARARYAVQKELEQEVHQKDYQYQQQNLQQQQLPQDTQPIPQYQQQNQSVQQQIAQNQVQYQNNSQNIQDNSQSLAYQNQNALLQQEVEELRRFKQQVEFQRSQQLPPTSQLPLQYHTGPDSIETSAKLLQELPDYTAGAQEISRRKQQSLIEDQANQASQVEQNKRHNQQSTQVARNLNPIDINNPRYKLYRNIDNQYSAVQIELQEHKNELNKLYSHKISRKEQLRINFLEQRVKELENDAGKLRSQLKIFEREFT